MSRLFKWVTGKYDCKQCHDSGLRKDPDAAWGGGTHCYCTCEHGRRLLDNTDCYTCKGTGKTSIAYVSERVKCDRCDGTGKTGGNLSGKTTSKRKKSKKLDK